MAAFPIKILVVEDEQLIADDLRETLEDLGYEVPAPVGTGEAAVAQVAAIQPDLVLMDIQLEGAVDGIEASEQIQSQFDIPIVFLTANADRVTLERVKATHPFGYLLKPYNEKVLSTTIEIALSRHQNEGKVRQALLTAEALSRQKSEYLAMSAHKLLNPVTAIQLAIEMLQQKGELLSKQAQQKHVQRIQAATRYLSDMLEKMLMLGQNELNKFPFEPTYLETVGFCRDQIEALQLTIDQRHQLTFSASVPHCYARLDAKLLKQILYNLLSNAVKYSPNGGAIQFSLTAQPRQIILQVHDQGIGIPPETQPRLFQPFYRANNVGKIAGTGLGLAIVKQCVDLHQGTIEVKSTLNQGTSISITLPI